VAFGCHGDHSEKVAVLEQRGQLSQGMSSLHLAVTQLERGVTCLRADIRAVGKGMLISANCGASITLWANQWSCPWYQAIPAGCKTAMTALHDSMHVYVSILHVAFDGLYLHRQYTWVPLSIVVVLCMPAVERLQCTEPWSSWC